MDLYSDEFDRNVDRTLKIILLGDTDSRKTEMFHAFIEKQEVEELLQTQENAIGLDSFIRDIEHKGKIIRLQVWDTSGLERFRTMTASYYREANGILLIYDSEKIDTFNSLDDWLVEIEEKAPADVVTLLVGTVENFDSEDRVSREEAERYVEKYRYQLKSCFECDPKDKDVVARIFHSLVSQFIQTSSRDTLPKGSGLAVRGHGNNSSERPTSSNHRFLRQQCSKC